VGVVVLVTVTFAAAVSFPAAAVQVEGGKEEVAKLPN